MKKERFELRNGKVAWGFEGDEKGVRRCKDLSVYPESQRETVEQMSTICEVQIRGRMFSAHNGLRHMQHSENGRFFYCSHALKEDNGSTLLTIVQESDIARLTSYFHVAAGTDTVRTWHVVENIGKEAFTLEYVGTYNDLQVCEPRKFDKTEFWFPTNGSYCECQWNVGTMKDLGIFSGHNMRNQKKILISNVGTWSTKTYLPMGVIRNEQGKVLLWQIEANGSWSYELGDLFDCATLHLNGPTFEEHNWQQTLQPGESFETVKAAITEGEDFNDAMANLTRYRRTIIRDTKDSREQPVIFNEYMYASWNTPSAETAKALAPLASKFGADYYVIDCGWHDEEPDPFYYVGRWEESKSRYPDGLKATLERIRKEGLIPGLWMEPEVVGALGDAKSLYPDSCYFSHNGVVSGVSQRYQLDFRSKEVRDRLDKIVDRLVQEYGVGYLKFDYNIEAGMGTDYNAESYGNGLLHHNRAVYDWMKGIADRYPDLIIENCASGGNRMDYLMMSVANMQSTSDQINYKIYPYIAANMFWALLPEQAAVWAYPAAHADEEQPDMECTVMNMINGMAGRMHLASKLYLLNEENGELVREGIEFYHSLAQFRSRAVPFFAGRPAKIDEGQIAFGLDDGETLLLFVYRMDGQETVCVPTGKQILSAEVVYPKASSIQPIVDGDKVSVKFVQEYSARVIQIKYKK